MLLVINFVGYHLDTGVPLPQKLVGDQIARSSQACNTQNFWYTWGCKKLGKKIFCVSRGQ